MTQADEVLAAYDRPATQGPSSRRPEPYANERYLVGNKGDKDDGRLTHRAGASAMAEPERLSRMSEPPWLKPVVMLDGRACR